MTPFFFRCQKFAKEPSFLSKNNRKSLHNFKPIQIRIDGIKHRESSTTIVAKQKRSYNQLSSSRTTKKSKKGLTDFNFNLARKKREAESKVEVEYNFSAGDATEIQFIPSRRGRRGQSGQDRQRSCSDVAPDWATKTRTMG